MLSDGNNVAEAVNILCWVNVCVGIPFIFHPQPTKIHVNCKKYSWRDLTSTLSSSQITTKITWLAHLSVVDETPIAAIHNENRLHTILNQFLSNFR